MLPFAKRNQTIALKLASGFAAHTPFQLWSRNMAMRLFPYLPGKQMLMKLAMRDIGAAARDVALPDLAP
jgi:hypothetical protein